MENHSVEIHEELSKHGFKLLDPIGNGGFATVYTVLNLQYNQTFCVKLMELTPSNDSSSKSDSNSRANILPQSFRAEIDSLINIINPNVVSIFDYFQSPNMLYIILEYCVGGSIDQLIKDEGPIDPPKLYSMCRQVISALSVCHDLGIAHRDIKPQNILLDQHQRPKLADFGLAQKLQKQELIERFSGSLPYKSPEILNMKPYDPFMADVWALGVTFYVMATGYLPWKANSMSEWKLLINGGPGCLPAHLDKRFTMIVKKMLEPNLRERATLEDVINCTVFYEKISDDKLVVNSSTKPTTSTPVLSTLSFTRVGFDSSVNFSNNNSLKNGNIACCALQSFPSAPNANKPVVSNRSFVFAKKRRCSKVNRLIQLTFNEDDIGSKEVQEIVS